MDWAQKAPVLIAIGSIFWRSTIKYGENGYRFAILEVGHVSQLIHLAAVSFGLGTCPIGGYKEHALNYYLGLDSETESIIAVIAIGYPVSNR